MRFIVRINNGYWVRFYKTSTRPVAAQKSFVFSKFKDHDTCLAAAKAWRDKKAKALKASLKLVSDDERKKPIAKKKARSNTGVIGVHHDERHRELKSGDVHITLSYFASWTEPKTARTKRRQYHRGFQYDPSIKGDKKRAFEAAKAHRLEMENKFYAK